jgi:GNAT superfamily N-acetyltransferase
MRTTPTTSWRSPNSSPGSTPAPTWPSAPGGDQARSDARPVVLPPGWTCAPAAEDDADDLAALYGEVFATYPFPIADPGYLRATMAGDYRYFIVRTEDGRLAAASSAEIYREDENVEMTDFAVHQAFRGKNLSGLLLSWMEEEMRAAGMRIRISAPSRAHDPLGMLESVRSRSRNRRPDIRKHPVRLFAHDTSLFSRG